VIVLSDIHKVFIHAICVDSITFLVSVHIFSCIWAQGSRAAGLQIVKKIWILKTILFSIVKGY
jgi:hypothetical protein